MEFLSVRFEKMASDV